MPRKFSEQQRRKIRSSLVEAGRRRFGSHGIGKTTVEELTADVGISKGAFYAFFETKEDLFFAILDEYEASVRAEIEEAFRSGGRSTKDALKTALSVQIRRALDEPFLKEVLRGLGGRSVWLSASDEARRRNLESDVDFIASIIPEGTIDARVAAGMLRGLVLLAGHREEIGRAVFDDVIERMIDAVVDHILQEGSGAVCT